MNTRTRISKPVRGFSLVELMIALAAGLVVSTAVVAFLLSSFKGNGDYVQSTRLTQELRNSMDLVTRDLRRAGYDGKSMQYVATGDISPFSRIQFCNDSDDCAVTATAPLTCVIYSYDRPNSTWGQVDIDNGEVRGIRRRTRTVNGRSVGVLEYAVSGGGVKPACAGAGPDYTVFPVVCNSATDWCPLSDGTRLDISSFTLALPDTTAGKVKLRDIALVMQGRIAGSTEYTRGIKSSVRVRTDCYDTDPSRCRNSP
jgi:prepilin-type N-terminal cleavage/methylation domain-containing protein